MDKLVQTVEEQFWNPEAYARDQWVKARAEQLPAGSVVLDAGAGASKYRPLFQRCKYRTQDFCAYTGPLVKYVQPIDIVSEISSIPLGQESLDAILCTEVFEHLVDPMAALREFARLLHRGGKLWITAPLLSSIHMEPYHYYSGFTKYWYEYWLPRLGFSIESIEWVGGPGRTSVVFLQAFYQSWARAESALPPIRRVLSKGMRAFAKLPIHYILPRIVPRVDAWLHDERVGSGLLVSATRNHD